LTYRQYAQRVIETPASTQSNNGPEIRKCEHCGKEGHSLNECYQRRNEQDRAQRAQSNDRYKNNNRDRRPEQRNYERRTEHRSDDRNKRDDTKDILNAIKKLTSYMPAQSERSSKTSSKDVESKKD
jgi:hypothetical protein